MGDLSAHFSRSEFACKCGCGFDTVDIDLVYALQDIRDALGPVTIDSGCRCKAHNIAIGGSAKSQHMFARAADFRVKDVPAPAVQDFVEARWPDRYGLGKYKNWTHLDTRRSRARWAG